jgi:hypothetical protein
MTEIHPFLMDDLIAEHQRDLMREASAERWSAKVSTGRPRKRPASATRRLVALMASRVARQSADILSVVALATLLALAAGQGQAEASSLVQTVRSFAENVLGRGMVKWVRVSPDSTVAMRWEAATYKPQHSLETSRELLYGEAALVTGAVLGPLQDIPRITFTMVRGEQLLATGDVSRSQGLTLTFAPVLGGGTHKKPEFRPGNQVPGGDRTASEL